MKSLYIPIHLSFEPLSAERQYLLLYGRQNKNEHTIFFKNGFMGLNH